MARQYVPMVLSGDGGDEAFAGYDFYRKWLGWLAYEGIATPSWRQRLRPFAERLMPDRYPARRPTLNSWLRFKASSHARVGRSLWRSEHRSSLAEPIEMLEKEFARTAGYTQCGIAQYLDIKSYLPYDILTKVDVASMMHGLEVRTPLTDIRVFEFAATIPDAMNIRKNGGGQWEGKLLLKKVLRSYYPEEFLQRPKMGFAVPISRWFGSDGALRVTVQERLLGSESSLSEFFDPGAINHLLGKDAASSLWRLLFLEEWLRQNSPSLIRDR